MGLVKLETGINLTTLTPFNKDSQSVGTGAFTNILSITGKGFLESFYCHQSAVKPALQIRIIVDGVVKVLLQTGASDTPIGLVGPMDMVVSNATSTGNSTTTPRSPTQPSRKATITAPASIKPYPTIDSSDGIILVGQAKIYFNSSLSLDVSADPTGGCNYTYSGGWK